MNRKKLYLCPKFRKIVYLCTQIVINNEEIIALYMAMHRTDGSGAAHRRNGIQDSGVSRRPAQQCGDESAG